MRWYKVKAFMFRDWRVFIRGKWKFFDFFYFPITTVLIWGLFALYSVEFALQAGLLILVVNVFWSFVYMCQSQINLLMNEDSWSGALKQVISSGVSEFEYIFARIISASLYSLLIMSILLTISYFFGFTALISNFQTVISLVLISLLVSISMSIFIAAMIIFLGRNFGFLAWTALQAFILLSAPFFPLDILPYPLQIVALGMPFTRIFATARGLVLQGTVSGMLLYEAALFGVIYLLIAMPLYIHAFRRARKTGKLVKMS